MTLDSRLPDLLRSALVSKNDPAFLDLLSESLPGRPGDLTRKNVLSSLRVYLRWAEGEGRAVLNAGPADAQAYLTHLLIKHDGAPSSVHNHLTRVRTLYRVLMNAGAHPGPNPYLGLKLPTNRPEEHRDFYAPAEVERLLFHAGEEGRALVALGAYGGLTGPETVRLRWEDFGPETGRLTVATRDLALDPLTHAALRTYGRTQGVGDLFGGTGRLFSFINDHQLRAALYALCRTANVNYRGWRALRNHAGLRLLRLTGDPQQVADALGLGTLKATEPWLKVGLTKS
ncbi:tyrosine-type recombinase/integrase [Deinococcus sp.]|uniref:tyrosine-type recombinase/integrase n=1 Tax=Deinococcus sp. TaxID=47478 RepID=UPI003CC56769